MKKNILILSDLHIGKTSRFPGLKIKNGGGEKEILEIKTALAKEKIKIDLIFVPGDLTENCDPSLINTANEFLTGLTKNLSLPIEKLICIPGNHDSNWPIMSIDDETKQLLKSRDLEKLELDFWFGQRYEPWVKANINLFQEGKEGALIEKPYCDLRLIDDVAIVVINTAAYDGPDHQHHGYISDDTFLKLSEIFQQAEIAKASYRVAMFHHHPLLYEDPTGFDKDFSALSNAEKLLRILSENAFDFIVHGHKHIPMFDTKFNASRPGFHILSAGSFGYSLPSAYNGVISNTIHVIQIDGRDSEEGYSNGILRTWSYITGKGWVPSQKANGLPHHIPFGPYFSEKRLSKLVEKALVESFSNRTWVEWKFITKLANYKNLAYINYDKVSVVLEMLQKKMDIKWVGNDVEELMIFKGDG